MKLIVKYQTLVMITNIANSVLETICSLKWIQRNRIPGKLDRPITNGIHLVYPRRWRQMRHREFLPAKVCKGG